MNQTHFFSQQDKASIDPDRIPKHIAIIPDGNRRWAKSKLFSTMQGHIAGADTSLKIVQAAKELGVQAVTLYCFSTENWKRPSDEVEHLLSTIGTYLNRYQNKLVEHNIRLRIIGQKEALGLALNTILDKTCAMTAANSTFDLTLAINYGGRDEICRAVQKLMHTHIAPEKVTQELLSQFLDTAATVDPDLIIRTSGEMRLSNFLLWQSSYAELYCSQSCWPDFTPHDLLDAIRAYQMRERRIGGTIS